MRNLDNRSAIENSSKIANLSTAGNKTHAAANAAHNFLPRRKILLDTQTSQPAQPAQKNTGSSPLENEQQILLDRIRLQLCNSLQTTLQLDTLLNIFFQQLGILVEVCGFTFKARNNEEFVFGSSAHHKLFYQLDTGKQAVGEITYFARHRISGNKLELLELATSTLIFPLLNAQLHAAALEQAATDPLTQLANRRSLESYLPSIVASAQRYQRPLSLLVIDIDHFKNINDSYGHQTGDTVLQAVAKVFHQGARASDRAFRYGGEEFVFVLDGSDASGAAIVAERLRSAVAAIELAATNVNIKGSLSVSIGYAELDTKPDKKESAKTLLQRADIALYQAKRSGRNRVLEG